jgi:hypothetical protein
LALDNLGKTTKIACILPLHEINTLQQKENPKPNSHSHNKVIINSILAYKVCFEGFCDVAKSGNHQENNLAKFGYILDMKVRKIHNPYFFWLPTRTLQKKIQTSHSKKLIGHMSFF